MKTKLLVCLTFLTINLSFGALHEITWQTPFHGTVNIEIGDTVRWNFTGFHSVISSGSPSFTSSGNQNGGTYEVTFNTIGNYYFFCGVHGAGSMDGTIVVTSTLGVDDIETDDFSIYPNPSKDELNFKLPKNNNNIILEVFDVFGKNIYTKKAFNLKNIYVNNWENGVYFLNIIIDKKRVVKVFIKE